ncbi:hypothetical protein PP590_gp18 [Pseudoalteromonas phage HS1]|nr:hypothetical protein PP589_gp52 [Pseudoalteromonas phage HS5]YP_010660175.1 hypothetical protein PP590_gp18 [Pseudoalteromonas phage HS1]
MRNSFYSCRCDTSRLNELVKFGLCDYYQH